MGGEGGGGRVCGGDSRDDQRNDFDIREKLEEIFLD